MVPVIKKNSLHKVFRDNNGIDNANEVLFGGE